MKLYRARIPVIAKSIIEGLVEENAIDVSPANSSEAELDLVAIMEEYQRRDSSLRNAVKDYMHARSVPYDQYGKVRSAIAQDWNHPTGDDVERFLARQFVEAFMISNFVEEVYWDDAELYRKIVDHVRTFDVDERAIRDEARLQLKNIEEGTVDYEIALNKAVRDVKKRYGLIAERERNR
jgi:hypothetical protein